MTLSTLLHEMVHNNGQDHHGEMSRKIVQHQLLTFCPVPLPDPQSAAPLLRDVNLGPGKATSQLHSE